MVSLCLPILHSLNSSHKEFLQFPDTLCLLMPAAGLLCTMSSHTYLFFYPPVLQKVQPSLVLFFLFKAWLLPPLGKLAVFLDWEHLNYSCKFIFIFVCSLLPPLTVGVMRSTILSWCYLLVDTKTFFTSLSSVLAEHLTKIGRSIVLV